MWTTCAECMTWYRNGSAWPHLVSIGEMRTLKRWVASHLLKWDKEFQKIFLEDLIFIPWSLLNSEWRPVSFQEKSWGKDWLWVLGVSCASFEGRTCGDSISERKKPNCKEKRRGDKRARENEWLGSEWLNFLNLGTEARAIPTLSVVKAMDLHGVRGITWRSLVGCSPWGR